MMVFQSNMTNLYWFFNFSVNTLRTVIVQIDLPEEEQRYDNFTILLQGQTTRTSLNISAHLGNPCNT